MPKQVASYMQTPTCSNQGMEREESTGRGRNGWGGFVGKVPVRDDPEELESLGK